MTQLMISYNLIWHMADLAGTFDLARTLWGRGGGGFFFWCCLEVNAVL